MSTSASFPEWCSRFSGFPLTRLEDDGSNLPLPGDELQNDGQRAIWKKIFVAARDLLLNDDADGADDAVMKALAAAGTAAMAGAGGAAKAKAKAGGRGQAKAKAKTATRGGSGSPARAGGDFERVSELVKVWKKWFDNEMMSF